MLVVSGCLRRRPDTCWARANGGRRVESPCRWVGCWVGEDRSLRAPRSAPSRAELTACSRAKARVDICQAAGVENIRLQRSSWRRARERLFARSACRRQLHASRSHGHERLCRPALSSWEEPVGFRSKFAPCRSRRGTSFTLHIRKYELRKNSYNGIKYCSFFSFTNKKSPTWSPNIRNASNWSPAFRRGLAVANLLVNTNRNKQTVFKYTWSLKNMFYLWLLRYFSLIKTSHIDIWIEMYSICQYQNQKVIFTLNHFVLKIFNLDLCVDLAGMYTPNNYTYTSNTQIDGRFCSF